MPARLIVEDDSYFGAEDFEALDPEEIELDEHEIERALAEAPATGLDDVYRT
jgi:hypothetical protein